MRKIMLIIVTLFLVNPLLAVAQDFNITVNISDPHNLTGGHINFGKSSPWSSCQQGFNLSYQAKTGLSITDFPSTSGAFGCLSAFPASLPSCYEFIAGQSQEIYFDTSGITSVIGWNQYTFRDGPGCQKIDGLNSFTYTVSKSDSALNISVTGS